MKKIRVNPFVLVSLLLALLLGACTGGRGDETSTATLEPTVQATATLGIQVQNTQGPTVIPATPNGDMATLQSQLTQAVAIVQTQGASMVLTAAAGQQQTPTQTPTVGASTLIPDVDCHIRTFIKDAGGYHEEQDAAVVLGKWNNGFGQFQTAKVCAWVVAEFDVNTFDVHWDTLANNVSIVLVPSAKVNASTVQGLANLVQSPRVGSVHTHPTGREVIDFNYDVAACGPITLFHIYDRADWAPNPVYDCLVLNMTSTVIAPTATPQQ
jgi:hypothetical protein